MKSFLTKISGFVTVLIAMQITSNVLLPAYWGNEVICKKYLKMESSYKIVNTVFIGTSRIHCHIDPLQFDKETNYKTESWNIAAPGAGGLETYRIVNELINNTTYHSIRTIYLEMPSYNAPPVENASNVRATYFLDIRRWWKSIAFMRERQEEVASIFMKCLKSSKLLISNLFGLNHFKAKLSVLVEKVYSQENNIANKNKGFNGLNRTAKDLGPIKTRLQFARKFYATQAKNEKNEIKYLTNDIQDLISKAEHSGIKLVYVLMPKIPFSKYEDNYQSFIQLNLKNRLNLSNPKEYPDFYRLKYSADKAHLNKKGAKLMTSEFAKHYNYHH